MIYLYLFFVGREFGWTRRGRNLGFCFFRKGLDSGILVRGVCVISKLIGSL